MTFEEFLARHLAARKTGLTFAAAMTGLMTFEEFLARHLAARKMGLMIDTRGMQLPDELWRQAIPDAEFICDVIASFDLYRLASPFHEENNVPTKG